MASREVVKKYISWEVNNGENAEFWSDSWNEQVPLGIEEKFKEIKDITDREWGSKVADVINAIEIFSRKGIWKDLATLPLSRSQCRLLSSILQQRTVYVSDKADKLFWVPSKDGCYSIKEGYRALQCMEESRIKSRVYSLCWNNIVLPKEGCFAWLAVRKRILTSDKLVKLGIVQPFKCSLYGMYDETGDHLLLRCDFAQQCWAFVCEKLDFPIPFSDKLWNLFESWPTINSNSMFAGLWKCILAAVVWAIW
ncbi:uncharacterized protein LOC131874440 [Cryptomeria japonica]|uniref:uncharacterized protein LOC131874440 n=1 Tax=Cryptomeria japonica TaxID=3369 RepID=UPI0027DA104C|nr:uncharacterized protein LOC131874440 [Cryptomeria japonica]